MGMRVFPFDPSPFHVGLVVAKVALDFSPRVVRFLPCSIIAPLISVDIYLSIIDAAQWNIWLKHCTTSRNVVGLISDGVFGILHSLYFSGRTMPLVSTQTLKEMSTKVAPWR